MNAQMELRLQQTREIGEALAILFVAKLADLTGLTVQQLALAGCWREISIEDRN
jgi:hypothetical protein